MSHDDQDQAGAWGRQRAQRPCFLFGAKAASVGTEYRGIRQRFPYRCNETKTNGTPRRRSPWSPRRRHHQSLLQAKTTFVRISCTSCPLSNWPPLLALFPLNIWGEDQAYISRTSHHRRTDGEVSHRTPSTPSTRTPQPQEAVLPLVLCFISPRGNPPPPHWSRVLHYNGGPN